MYGHDCVQKMGNELRKRRKIIHGPLLKKRIYGFSTNNNLWSQPILTKNLLVLLKKEADYEYALAKDCIIPILDDWGINLRNRGYLT